MINTYVCARVDALWLSFDLHLLRYCVAPLHRSAFDILATMPDTFSMARLKHKTSSRIHLTRSFDHGNIAPAADHQAVEARDHEKAAEEGQAPGPSRQMSTLVVSLESIASIVRS